MDVAEREASGQDYASGTMMGPEFEIPAKNWFRASGDSVYKGGVGQQGAVRVNVARRVFRHAAGVAGVQGKV